MFHRRTLFVVGAGASAEVNFPVGTQLARAIARKMDVRFQLGNEFIGSGDEALYQHLMHVLRNDGPQWHGAAMRLKDGLPFAQSVDDFLDQHRNDRFVNTYGKAAIAKAISEAERESTLFFDPPAETKFDDDRLRDTWFVKLMFMLSRGVPREQFSSIFQNVDFIVFNYDRCVEHFLINALARSYSMRREDAGAIVNKVGIVHSYGSVGDLMSVPFGTDRLNWVSAADGIKTYTEQAAASEVLKDIQKKVEWAECIVFLGFAYHSQNMKMLQPSIRTDKVIYGTAYGMSGPDVTEVNKLIAKTFAPREIHTDNLKCAALFDHYAKSLTGGD
jgi:hypothetical protein